MKKTALKTLLASLLLLLVIGGCENLLDFSFDTDYSSVTFIVNPEEAGNYVESYQYLKTDLDSIVASEGKNLADLESVKIKDATVEVIGDGNFDPVESIEITIEAEGLDKIVFASKTNVEEGLTFANLDYYEGELKGYLEADEYKLTITLHLDEDLEEAMQIQAQIKYKITVGI
jgi:hypothetical protein